MAMTPELSHQPTHPIFTSWCAATGRRQAPAPEQRILPSIHNVLAFAPRGWATIRREAYSLGERDALVWTSVAG